MKRYFECTIEELVDYKMIEEGGVVLLYGRPAVGKTKTALDVVSMFCFQSDRIGDLKYDFLYFDLSEDVSAYFKKENEKLEKGDMGFSKEEILDLLSFQKGELIGEFQSSLEIIKRIEEFSKGEKSKFVIIDCWQDLQDKGEWFVRALLNIVYHHKIILLVLSGLPRKVIKRKMSLPNIKDLEEISGNMLKLSVVEMSRLVVVMRDEKGLKYFVKKDKF